MNLRERVFKSLNGFQNFPDWVTFSLIFAGN
jgi:hypothetical protein